MPPDPYEVLQVSKKAEPEVIDAAYRRLARKYHPDVDRRPTATARMQEINRAYEILRDPIERSRYDYESRLRSQPSYKPSEPTASPYSAPPPPPPATPHTQTESGTTSHLLHPPAIVPVLIACLLLALSYLAVPIFLIAYSSGNTVAVWVIFAVAILASIVLAGIAASGWHPAKLSAWRALVLLPLTFFPVLMWIPCYLAAKAVARRLVRGSVEHPSPIPLIVYAVLAVWLSFLVFGGPGASP